MVSYVIGLAALVAVLTLWVAAQVAWRRVFGAGGDPDVLARRGGCHGCDIDQEVLR